MPASVPGLSAYSGEAEQHSELKPNSIPGQVEQDSGLKPNSIPG